MNGTHPIVADLRAERISRGLSQSALAELVGMDRATLVKAEKGKCQTTLANLSAWAQALGFKLKLEREE